MKLTILTLAFSLLALPAKADILFFDLNFSPTEIEAAKTIADRRGEKLILFPERTEAQAAELDRLSRLSHEHAYDYGLCLKRGRGGCEDLKKRSDRTTSILRAAASNLRALNEMEIVRIVEKIHSQRIPLSTIVFSGHSSGRGSFFGILGSLRIEILKKALERAPGLFESVRSIYLWGCYSGTLDSTHNTWRAAFPWVKFIAGYQKRSPLGIRNSSGAYLMNLMSAEARLLQTTNLREAHALFRSVRGTNDLEGTLELGDFYLNAREGRSIAETIRRCQSFPEELFKQFKCYDLGEAGCENPPADHLGPLREFYGYLQENRHCADLINTKFPGIPSPDYVIRLIYIEEVKKNFVARYGSRFGTVDAALSSLGLPAKISLKRISAGNRRETNKLFNDAFAWFSRIQETSRLSEEQNNRVDWLGMVYLTAAKATIHPVFASFGREQCVPLSWIEAASTEADQCSFQHMLAMSGSIDPLIQMEMTIGRIFRQTPELVVEFAELTGAAGELRSAYLKSLKAKIELFESYTDRNEVENAKLNSLKRRFAETEAESEAAIARRLDAAIVGFLADLDRRMRANDIDGTSSFVLDIKSKLETARTVLARYR